MQNSVTDTEVPTSRKRQQRTSLKNEKSTMAELKFEQNLENQYYQMDDSNPYEVLTMNLETMGELEEDRKEKGKNTSRICVKTVVIFVVLVLVVVCVTMTMLYLQERNKSRNETQGETESRNQKTMVCPNVPSTGMNYSTAGKTGIQGRQFLLCFTENHPNAGNQSKTIYVISDDNFDFKIISKFSDSTQLYNEVETPTKNVKEINVTTAIAISDSKIEEKALLIETSRDVSVIIIDNYKLSSDSTVILPIKSLSNAYVISTSKAFNKTRGPQFAIASQRNGTVIRILLKFDPNLPKKINGITYRDGREFILVLNELQTYEMSHSADLSGTLINASSPISVFAGSYCEKIVFRNSSNSGYCSKLDEQLPPIDRLDNMYIVPPNYNRMGTVLKIVSPFHNRCIYKIGKKETVKTLHPSGYFEISFSNDEVVVIDSEKPVLVTSFSTGSDDTGDPYMNNVPGIRQYTDKYLVMVPENFKENYVGLTIEEKSLKNLMLNETKIIHYLNDRKFYTTVTIRDMNFVVLVLQVQGGLLRVKSTNNAAFGLVVYGHRKNDGHGFAGKAVLPDVCVHPYE